MSPVCGVLHGEGMVQAVDTEGCVLPDGHDGPHEFVDARNGARWQWETNWDCQCQHCLEADGDFCTVYWRKAPSTGNR